MFSLRQRCKQWQAKKHISWIQVLQMLLLFKDVTVSANFQKYRYSNCVEHRFLLCKLSVFRLHAFAVAFQRCPWKPKRSVVRSCGQTLGFQGLPTERTRNWQNKSLAVPGVQMSSHGQAAWRYDLKLHWKSCWSWLLQKPSKSRLGARQHGAMWLCHGPFCWTSSRVYYNNNAWIIVTTRFIHIMNEKNNEYINNQQ